MAKLPENFVKAPATTSRLTTSKPTAGKEIRRKKRGGLDLRGEASEPHGLDVTASDVHSVLVQLSPDQRQALVAACEALAAVGEIVTVEGMIKQVIMRWMDATRATHVPAERAPHRSPSPAPETITAQLRRMAEQPLRQWRELSQTLRVWSRVFKG